MLQRFSGAFVRRIIDRSGGQVPEHAHDWPLLSLFVIGAYSNETELGASFICGPSAILYAAGAAHRNSAGPEGFEQIEIEFDPAWLKSRRLGSVPVLRWVGGRGGAEALSLARLCSQSICEKKLLKALRGFLEIAPAESQPRSPEWLSAVSGHLRANPASRVRELAREARLHPSWLGTAYCKAVGEGIMGSAARFRVERATRLLRETDLPLAWIANEAGFCDQSHMVRAFRRVLGRAPTMVRDDRVHFRQLT
jgi:AraC family transcriptional regulator